MKFDLAKEQQYAKLALEHCRIKRNALKKGEDFVLPVIEAINGRPTEGWNAWRHYFTSHLDFLPHVMQRIESGFGSGKFTVPSERPEQFDESYTPPDYIPPAPGRLDPSSHLTRLQRMEIAKRVRSEMEDAKRPEPVAVKNVFSLYSEDELRKMYPPRGGNSERAE